MTSCAAPRLRPSRHIVRVSIDDLNHAAARCGEPGLDRRGMCACMGLERAWRNHFEGVQHTGRIVPNDQLVRGVHPAVAIEVIRERGGS